MLRRASGPLFCLLALGACAHPSQPVVAPAVAEKPATAANAAPAPTPTLCDATPRILSELTQPLQLDVYFTRGTPALATFRRDLETLLTSVTASARQGRVTVRFIDSSADDAKASASDAGLQMQTFGEMVQDGAALVTRGYSGIVLRYGHERDAIKYLPPDGIQGVELWLITKIRELHARESNSTFRIGVVAGHRERSLAEEKLMPGADTSMAKLFKDHYPIYRLETVDLTKGDPDPALTGLILMQPEDDLDDASLARIDAFVMRGRALVVVASAANMKAGDPTMTVTIGTHRLNKLLSGYGIELHEDLVLDLGKPWSVTTSAGSLHLPYIPIVPGDADSTPSTALQTRGSIFFRASDVVFPFASSITIDATKQPAATFATLAESSDQTIRSRTSGSMWPKTSFDTGQAGRGTLAAQVEGPLSSAFGKGKSQGRARVLVLASSWAFANPFWSAPGSAAKQGPPLDALGMAYAQAHTVQSILTLKNTLDWASDGDLARCAPAPRAAQAAGASEATRSTGTSGDKR
jgi:hypothetical protein